MGIPNYSSLPQEIKDELNWRKYLSANPLIAGCRGCKYLVLDGIPNCSYFLITGHRRPMVDGECAIKNRGVV